MDRSLCLLLSGVILTSWLMNCQKIAYPAIERVDQAIFQIDQNQPIRPVFMALFKDSILEEQLHSEWKKCKEDPAFIDCLEKNGQSSIRWLQSIREYLLYRRTTFPDYAICTIQPDQISLDPSQDLQAVEISGFNLPSELSIEIKKDNSWRQLSSTYYDLSTSSSMVYFGGDRGYPLDTSIQSIKVDYWGEIKLNKSQPESVITTRTHVQRKGWISNEEWNGWNGSRGEGLGIIALTMTTSDSTTQLQYQISRIGKDTSDLVESSKEVGIIDENSPMDGIKIDWKGTDWNLEYRGHIQDVGDSEWVSSGNWLGLKGKRLEAFQLRLTKSD